MPTLAAQYLWMWDLKLDQKIVYESGTDTYHVKALVKVTRAPTMAGVEVEVLEVYEKGTAVNFQVGDTFPAAATKLSPYEGE